MTLKQCSKNEIGNTVTKLVTLINKNGKTINKSKRCFNRVCQCC